MLQESVVIHYDCAPWNPSPWNPSHLFGAPADIFVLLLQAAAQQGLPPARCRPPSTPMVQPTSKANPSKPLRGGSYQISKK